MKKNDGHDSTINKDVKEISSEKKSQLGEKDHKVGTSRTDINEISKRNEAIAKQERKSFYKIVGIIVFLVIAIIFLLYFFS